MKEGWLKQNIGEIAAFSQGIQVGLKHHKYNPSKGYVRFIRIVDYTQDTDDIRYVKDPGEKYYVTEDDIVMVRYGTPGLIGRGKSGVIANNLFKISINNEGISNDYLSLYLSQSHIQKYLSTQGSSTMPALTFGQLKKVEINYPKSIGEQKAIVKILDEAFAKIDQAKANIEKNIENAKELFQSKLDRTYEVFKSSSRKLGEMIELLTDYHANGSYKVLKQNVELKNEEDYAWMVRSTDFEKGFKNNFKYINKHAYDYLKKSKIFGGEIIISKIGNAGKVYVMPKIDRPCSLAMNLFLLRLKKNEMSSKFLFYFLKTTKGEKQILSKLKGMATKTITKDSVRDLNIPQVDFSIQNQIILDFEEIESKNEELKSCYRKKLIELEELKKSLLQKAFAGELTKMSKP